MWIWSNLWTLLFLGYSLFGRSFAYLGVPSLKVFIGEVVLSSFLLILGGRALNTWAVWLLRRSSWAWLGWSLYMFVFYGLFQLSRGIVLGHEPLLALQNFVFNIYPFYLFLGFQVAHAQPQLLRRIILWLAWLNGLYGVAYLLGLSRISLYLPWVPDVPLFGQPTASAVAILGLLALERPSLKVGLLILLNFAVLLGIQVRGEWLSLALGLVTWALLLRKVGRLAFIGLLAFAFFVFLYVAEVRVPAPEQRGGELSVQGVVARVLAPLNPEAAANLIGEEAYSLAGTITGWRLPWWSRIFSEVHVDPTTTLLGLAYGYPLWSLFELIPEGIRTPHNVLFYALGYGGWIGVGLFLLFLTFLGATLYHTWTATRRPEAALSFVLWIALTSAAFFGNFFETPFGAIPFYLLTGFGLGLRELPYAHPKATHPLPTAWR